jgi:Fic family protein
MRQNYTIPNLPVEVDLETRPILKALVGAKSSLAHLKGIALSLPNPDILIDTLSIQEAQASSEVENIVTTQDDIFKGEIFPDQITGPAKEVARYRDALRLGLRRMSEQQNLLTNATLVEMFRLLKDRDDGFRRSAGTAVVDQITGQRVHIPPQDNEAILRTMASLERFINDAALSDLDPLIKMAVIHHQFESIHPFPDGNGRIGRILNVLYLTQQGLLDTPILYLSRHINRTKTDYYRLLQAVRDDNQWEAWVLYMLTAIDETARITLEMVVAIREQMADYKRRMRETHPKFYSHDLLNNLVRHPSTRIDYVMRDLGVSRPTATKYLDALTQAGFVEKHQIWRDNYYVNVPLIMMFQRFG